MATDRRIELTLLGVLALFWGSSYLLIALAVQAIGPITLVAIRVSIAAMVLVAIAMAQGHRLPRDRATWLALSIQAFFNSFGAWTLLAWGQQHVDSGLAGVLNSTAPIFVILITVLLMGQPSSLHRVLGALVGLSGVVLIMGPEVLGGLGQQALAQAAVLAGAVLYAFAALYGRRFARLPPVVTAAGTMIVASLVLIPMALVFEDPGRMTPSLMSLAAASALGLFCTGLALLLYFRLIKTLGPVGVASQAYLRAGVAVVLGILFLGESFSVTIALGIGLALSGVLLINWPR